jgi:hypothetical protein
MVAAAESVAGGEGMRREEINQNDAVVVAAERDITSCC